MPLPGAPSAPAATPGGPLPAAPKLPGNMAAGPGGPGGSQMVSPGPGAGNEAAADALVAKLMDGLYQALKAYPLGSKKHQAVIRAVTALSANFHHDEGKNLGNAALTQMAMSKPTGPMAGARPTGIAALPPGAGNAPPGGAGPPPPLAA